MSEERSKISLRSGGKRKGRPTISAPRQISSPIPQDDAPPRAPAGRPMADETPRQQPRPPPQSSGKTSDLVKRRYSTRFNNIPADFDPTVNPMPSLPNFDRYEQPQDRRPPQSRGGESGGGGGGGVAPQVDVRALRDPKLSADQYVAEILSDATEDEIRDYEATLRQLKSRAATDLQQNVYQNRTQFIKISKEAEKLKSEMRTLKNLMSELKTNTTALRSASNNADVSSFGGEFSLGLSKRDKRSSVADRTALWSSQMQALYKNVEGSQKFLPNSQGRHVVQNAGPWIELDNATYKARRLMQIFLLNDHLLVASRKKRKTDGPNTPDTRGPMTKLVADRCWHLLDVEVVDMAGTSESSSSRNKLADAIMVRGGGQNESFIYRTEKPEDPEKAALFLNIRKTVEELRRNLQSEREATNKAKETINYFASRDPGLLQKTELLETLSDIKDMLIEVDGKQQNLRWVESQMDELDINIALQQIEPAVVRIEKLKSLAYGLKNNVIAQDFISFKVDERCTKLAGLVVRELVRAHDDQRKTKRNVSWLARLGFEDRAREAYLEARNEIIQKRSRQCIFQGDLHLYIWEISFVYFTIIRNTVSCFQACFPPPMMSACVKWAKEEVDAFNALLARQLSSAEEGGEVLTQCVSRAREHAKMLSDVGLDFRNLVARGHDLPEAVEVPQSPVGLGLS
ncbi:Cullin repeat-like-containing domain protein [Podospora appendiculata]|uniref:Exocyst complex component EXO84 n=1 Tax=Podospora appendiculata TaxID=314037 RepID=A0AAE0X950_9PEZI|nr:Cullin repeat-like-containing domain protein [Podospora appendiculata]